MSHQGLRFKSTENINDVHERLYDALDKLLKPYLGPGKPTHEMAYEVKFMVDEIIDNFYPPAAGRTPKDYDKVFTFIRLDISVSSKDGHECEINLVHDGNDFDPFSPNSPCQNIKASYEKIRARNKNLKVGSCGEEKRGFNLKFYLNGENQ